MSLRRYSREWLVDRVSGQDAPTPESAHVAARMSDADRGELLALAQHLWSADAIAIKQLEPFGLVDDCGNVTTAGYDLAGELLRWRHGGRIWCDAAREHVSARAREFVGLQHWLTPEIADLLRDDAMAEDPAGLPATHHAAWAELVAIQLRDNITGRRSELAVEIGRQLREREAVAK